MRLRCIFIALCICLFTFPLVLVADDYYIQWADTIDNGDWDGAFGVTVDNSNNIIVTGKSYIGGNNDYFTVKYDSNGTILWQDTLDNGEEDLAEAVAVDNANNIIMTGYCDIGGDYDYFTVKYDSSGIISWVDIIDNNGLYDIARGVAVDNSNNIIVTGYCDIGSDCVYFTVKYDSNGTILWADTLDNGPFDSAFDVAIDNANNIIVTGYTSTGVNNDYFTVKYDSNGTILWQDTLDNHQYDQAYGVAVDNSNNIIVTGCSGEAFSDYDYFTVKYDPNGTILWQDTLDNNDRDDVAYGVAVDNSNNIIVTGYSVELLGDYDYFTVKYDSNGTILWQDTLDNGNDDIAHGVAVDDFNNIIITGKSYIGGNFDYFTVKYAPIPGISEDEGSDLLSNNPIFYDIYPNPFREKTYIKFQIPSVNSQTNSNSQITMKIYDVAGMLVRRFDHATIRLSDKITWHGQDNSGNRLPSGVYFLKFQSGNYSGTEKLLLIK
jgi:uncharacterized delta-60 repeat protein